MGGVAILLAVDLQMAKYELFFKRILLSEGLLRFRFG